MAEAFEPAFAGRPARRIYLDLPGTGGSIDAGLAPTSDEVLAAVEQTVANLLGDELFDLAGHSYGGYLAAGLARRRPRQVEGLLLICPAVRILKRNLDQVLASVPDPDWLADIPADLHQHFAQAIGTQTRLVASRLATVLAGRGPMDDEYLDSLQHNGYRLIDEDSAELFGGTVSILVGGRDRIAGHLDQLQALGRYPQGNYAVLAAAGHYLPFEQPEAFADLAIRWWERPHGST
jgi:pimeloyl-ACP methyl ester carboxylesterase